MNWNVLNYWNIEINSELIGLLLVLIIFNNDGMIAFIDNYKKKAIKNKYFRQEIYNITDFYEKKFNFE